MPPKYTILYVDDEVADLKFFDVLMKQEYEVITATSGEEGLKILDTKNVDLIVADQSMPEMNGVEFFKKVLYKNPGPNRILISSFSEPATIKKAINEGKIYKYIQKPIEAEELKSSVHDAITNYYLNKDNLELHYKLEQKDEEIKKLTELNELLKNKIQERTTELSKLSEAVIQSPVMVLITDPKGIIEYINPKFTEVTGYHPNEAIGKPSNILNSGHHPSGYYTKLWDTILKGNNWHGEFCNKTKDGELFWDYTMISAIKNNENKITHFVAVKEDITNRKLMEQELNNALQVAHDANNSKSQFIANMSHEIRSPMNAILGISELLAQVISGDLPRHYLTLIQSSTRNMLTLINDILDLSKIEAGKFQLQFDYINLVSLINELKSVYSFKASEKGLNFIVEVHSSIPEIIFIDVVRIQQVLMNLLNNAIKFTEKGYIKLSVSATKHRQTKKNSKVCDLAFHIEDTGIGISKNSQDTIFDSYTQQLGQDYRKYGGTGLGLSISRILTNLMNGELTVQSEPGKGSTFSFVLQNIKYVEEMRRPKGPTKLPKGKIDFLGANALIVDDLVENRVYLNHALLKYNIHSYLAENGRDALKYIKTNKPNIIITDVLLPIMDGWQLISKIRQYEEHEKTPVIVTSAISTQTATSKVDNNNNVAFLKKPFTVQELIDVLVKLLPYEISAEKIQQQATAHNTKKSRQAIINKELLFDKLDKLSNMHASLVQSRKMETFQNFATYCISIADEFDLPDLQQYGMDIKEAYESFNVETLINKLKLFEPVISEIKNL